MTISSSTEGSVAMEYSKKKVRRLFAAISLMVALLLGANFAWSGEVIGISQFTDDITNPIDRWNIADRSSDEEMGAALDYLLEQIAEKPQVSLQDLETDDAQYRERNEIAFDKFIDVLWYSPNLELKKKVVRVWAWIDDWPKVERIFRDSGSQITAEKMLYAIAHLREDVRHSKYHFDSEFVGKLELIEKRIQQAPHLS